MRTTMAAEMWADTQTLFLQWLGEEYDLMGLRAVLAAAAVEQLDGDPVWLLMVSGSGNAKTETVVSLKGAGALVTSTIASEGALLSATSSKERSKDATGGLLRKIGSRGLLVIKDVTSILSMNRETRGMVLAALREVYDGDWTRNVGTDGGRTLDWHGRIVLIGAVTTAYDAAHGVIASMGDRFALVRIDSTKGRQASGRQALMNVGHEIQMREELAASVGSLLRECDPGAVSITDPMMTLLLALADLVTLARTAVERDHRGEPLEAHAPEAPTRFAKMLAQLVRGGQSLGMDDAEAVEIAVRVASDSVPPVRLLVLGDVLAFPGTKTSEVQQRTQRPRTSVDRALQELQLLGLVTVGKDGRPGWTYTVAKDIDTDALGCLVPGNVSNWMQSLISPISPSTDFSG